MLQETGKFNKLSPELLKKLEDRISSFGQSVRYRFDIEQANPDPEKYNGKTVFPSMYTLKPATFTITDKIKGADGKEKPSVVNVGLIKDTDDKGNPTSFIKIRITAGMRGILRLELDKEEDRAMCMFIELNPKLSGGDFSDPSKFQVISRIDESKVADTQRKERSARLKAMAAAENMSFEEIKNFADAMQWDSSEKENVLRNSIEALAQDDPAFFNELVEGKDIQYRAVVKQALDKKIIIFDPAEYKFTWSGNKQNIAILSPIGEKNEVEKLADFLQTGDTKIFEKLKSLTSGKAVATA